MATGPEHYREAERLIESTGRMSWSSDAGRDVTLAAQVHALLALTAAVALAHAGGLPVADHDAWWAAAGSEPVWRAQPQGGGDGE